MTRWILPIILTIALFFTGLWGYNQYVQNQQYSTHMNNIYQKSFYELVGNVNNVETRLGKLMVSGDRGQHMMLLSEICRQSDAAMADLAQLPISHTALMETSKYLNQLSDYSYYLSKKVSGGKTLSVEEMDNLQKLHENAARLGEELNGLERNIQKGGFGWVELSRKGRSSFHDAAEDIVTEQFIEIERNSIDYPALIYDGPFSEALKDQEKVEIEGPVITQKQAEDIAADFVGRDRVKQVSNASQGRGDIDTWGVYIETNDDSGPIYLSVTKKGGLVLNMISEQAPKETKLSLEQAKDRALKFLKQKGYPDMAPTYQQFYDGVTVINFAYQQNDIIIYPDLIKVKISLKDGSVLGFEARNFIISHKERDLDEPKLTMEEARKLVSPNLNVTSERLAVIPTETRKERLCYEFKGTSQGKNYIVYIDANTGEEASILQVIDTDNGSLAI